MRRSSFVGLNGVIMDCWDDVVRRRRETEANREKWGRKQCPAERVDGSTLYAGLSDTCQESSAVLTQ